MATPRLFGTGLWLTATMASTAIVWTATSTVAEDVTDRPAPVIAHSEVVDELQSGSPEAQTTTSTVRRTTSTAAPSEPVAPSPPVSGPPTTARPVITIAPSSPSTTAAAPSLPPTTRPAAQPATRPTATFSTTGGVVRVACEGYFFIELLSATPTDGYAVSVVSGGPADVEVHFVRFGQDLSVKAFCLGQPIRYYDESQRPRTGGS